MADPNGAAMPVKPVNLEEGTGTYTFSVYANADSDYSGNLRVKLVDAQGKAITDEQTVSLDADGTWKKVSAKLTSTVSQNTKGMLELTVEGAQAGDALCLGYGIGRSPRFLWLRGSQLCLRRGDPKGSSGANAGSESQVHALPRRLYRGRL